MSRRFQRSCPPSNAHGLGKSPAARLRQIVTLLMRTCRTRSSVVIKVLVSSRSIAFLHVAMRAEAFTGRAADESVSGDSSEFLGIHDA
jgi:hypothetical protein